MTITILDLAIHRGAKVSEDGSINGAEIEKTGLPFMGGCCRCQATIAAYNAAPTTTGYIACASECAEGIGYATVEEANADIFPEG